MTHYFELRCKRLGIKPTMLEPIVCALGAGVERLDTLAGSSWIRIEPTETPLRCGCSRCGKDALPEIAYRESGGLESAFFACGNSVISCSGSTDPASK